VQVAALSAGGCLAKANISTILKFGNILYGCLRQVGCLIKVTANSGLTVGYTNGTVRVQSDTDAPQSDIVYVMLCLAL